MLNTVTLPNGLEIANVTPHAITFWTPEWGEPIEVPPSGKVINARANEVHAKHLLVFNEQEEIGKRFVQVGELVRTEFVAHDDAEEILAYCESIGALVVGSIIAAQAYPGRVVAMTPAPGYERVAVPLPGPVQEAVRTLIAGVVSALDHSALAMSGQEAAAIHVLQGAMSAQTKRMNPNKFTVFSTPADGVYAIQDGQYVKIDSFTWGYEGEAPVAAAKVVQQNGTNCLIYGPGMDYVNDGVVWSM